ncbi:MAG: peptide chain release factor aRF-1 [Candidatus Nanoarchaeia archaeon]
MALTERQKYELKETLKELEQYRGRHTELVSVYVPSGYDINKIVTHLNDEQGTAYNIKSPSTRKNVIDALEKMIQHLKLYQQTPQNGVALFSGNVAEREGQSDVKVWSIEPPEPLNTRIYRCDKQFTLDLLREMLDDKNVYGLIVLDRREADVAILKGKSITKLNSLSSNVPGKTKAGGQSAARYGRIREDAAKEFYKKTAETVKDEFLGKEGLKGIIVGGPGPTKYEFLDGNYMPNELKEKVIGTKDISYTGDFGVQELVELSDDILGQEEIMEEKKIMGRFFEGLAKTPGQVAYGLEEIKNLLMIGAVETVLVSDAVENKIIEELEYYAKSTSAEVRIISSETREGVQLRDMGKFGALLRYDVSDS